MAKDKKKKATLDSLDAKIDHFREAVISGFEHINNKFDKKFDDLHTEMMKMRDDIRAVDSKVSGVWNVIDMHIDRIKKLEFDVQKLKAKR